MLPAPLPISLVPADWAGEVLRLLVFILPAYVANASPVLLGGHFPIDGGRRAWDGRAWLGPSKTWLGLLSGLAAGFLCSVLMAHLLPGTPLDLWGGARAPYLSAGLALCAGTMAGDLLGSLIKRRLGSPSGSPSFMLDQLTFLLVALAAVVPLGPSADFVFRPFAIVFLVGFTYLVHRAANAFAHAWGLKRVPW